MTAGMGFEIRSPSEGERVEAMLAGMAAFAAEPAEGELEREKKIMPLDRFLAAYDGGRPVGAAGSLPFELTVPGGTLPAGGVTWVAVLPSHRRRGILRQFMEHQLNDLHERAEPLAVLWASESVSEVKWIRVSDRLSALSSPSTLP